jgi:hypothetical protein
MMFILQKLRVTLLQTSELNSEVTNMITGMAYITCLLLFTVFFVYTLRAKNQISVGVINRFTSDI